MQFDLRARFGACSWMEGCLMRRQYVLFAISLLMGATFSSAPAQPLAGAVVSGGVRSDQGGQAVRGRVRLVRRLDASAPKPLFENGGKGPAGPAMAAPGNVPVITGRTSGQGRSDAAGNFELGAGPATAGPHLVCFTPDDFEHLDPCKWGTPASMTVTANQPLSLGNLVVKRGTSLKVVIEDPTGLMGSPGEASVGAPLQVGHYYPNGIFEPMRLESAVAMNRGHRFLYSVAIPPDVDLRIGINSTRITLTDAAGGAVALNRSAYALRAAATERQKTFVFRVSGSIGVSR